LVTILVVKPGNLYFNNNNLAAFIAKVRKHWL
jgi:hypothetical protein